MHIDSLPQLIISVVLFLVLFFGISFLLNMVLRATWLMVVFYPIIVVLIVDKVKFIEYFTAPSASFSALWQNLIHLKLVDILILTSGLVGVIISGIIIRMLRARGYQMF